MIWPCFDEWFGSAPAHGYDDVLVRLAEREEQEEIAAGVVAFVRFAIEGPGEKP